jgi:LmbE family N-acetylglucosaminyl deacetylase
MNSLSWRAPIRQFYQFLLHRTVKIYDSANFCKSTLIVAPHPDDETLGCGGTIIRKKQTGAVLNIVFMTDGSRSHAHLIPETTLKKIRRDEALAAAEQLGVDATNVHFLDFTDGNLNDHRQAAISLVVDLLKRFSPEEIFVPCAEELPPDHFATYEIVMTAIEATAMATTVYEYPIWFWDQYPWTNRIYDNSSLPHKLLTGLMSGFGLSLISQFRQAVYIRDVLEIKQAALAQHRSQMQPLSPDARWLTLPDLSKGEFLNCFFQDYEVFRKREINRVPSRILDQERSKC